jgi:hypothetical protein
VVYVSNAREPVISSLSVPIIIVKIVNDLHCNITRRIVHSITSTLLLTTAKTMTMKKKKMTSLINFVMKNLMTILVEMEHGEISWENPSMIKVQWKILFIPFIPNLHSIISIRMFIVDAPTPIVFVADTLTIFVLVFTTLLFITWIALILWVCSIINRDSNPNKPDDIELAVQGQSLPQPPLHPSPTILPSSPLRPPPAYLSHSCPQSWGNLFINRPLHQQDDYIPSRPLLPPAPNMSTQG